MQLLPEVVQLAAVPSLVKLVLQTARFRHALLDLLDQSITEIVDARRELGILLQALLDATSHLQPCRTQGRNAHRGLARCGTGANHPLFQVLQAFVGLTALVAGPLPEVLKVLRDPGFDGLQRIIQVFAQFQLQLIHTFFQVQRHPIAFVFDLCTYCFFKLLPEGLFLNQRICQACDGGLMTCLLIHKGAQTITEMTHLHMLQLINPLLQIVQTSIR
mmetsp:Transcript_47664/g.96993  ORF Transcript_47664/g.96993 Transcript_47664/m.96993 type:complete len:217 (-) Transcript_47664:71-721(-)